MHDVILAPLTAVLGAVMGALGTGWAASRQSRIDRAARREDEWQRGVDRRLDELGKGDGHVRDH